MVILLVLAFVAGVFYRNIIENKKSKEIVEDTKSAVELNDKGEEVDNPFHAGRPKEKPTRSSVMHYPTPEDVRRGKSKKVVDTFFEHLAGGLEKKSGTISDPSGL